MTGMPSGRRRPLAFGTYTRLTGRGVHDPDRCCTQSASAAFWEASSAVLPSTPAVSRPALISVTRRTLIRAFARERSMSFCRFLALARSPACVAVKMRCRSRRTSSSARCQSTDSQPEESSSGPFTIRCPTCPSVPGPAASSPHRLTWPRQHPFGSGQPPVSGRLSRDGRRRSRPWCPRFPAAFQPPAFASWPSCSRRGIGLPHGQPTGPAGPDPVGVSTFRTIELRPGWVPSIPRGRWCPPGRRFAVRPAPAASLRPVPASRWSVPPGGTQT